MVCPSNKVSCTESQKMCLKELVVPLMLIRMQVRCKFWIFVFFFLVGWGGVGSTGPEEKMFFERENIGTKLCMPIMQVVAIFV